MKTNYLYIYMIELTPRAKTSRWIVRSNRNDHSLGAVKWYSPWRQYCFEPVAGTVFSAGCLADIQEFITGLMATRRPA